MLSVDEKSQIQAPYKCHGNYLAYLSGLNLVPGSELADADGGANRCLGVRYDDADFQAADEA